MDRPREDENIQVFAKQKRQSIHIGRYEVDIVYVDSLGFLFIESRRPMTHSTDELHWTCYLRVKDLGTL